jgi:outer membrane protein assembly factor BamB
MAKPAKLLFPFLAAAVAAGLAAHAAPPESGFYSPIWRADLPTEAALLKFFPQEHASPAAAPLHRLVFTGTSSGGFYGLDFDTGHVRWSTNIGAPVNSSPLVRAPRVYFGATDGSIHALDMFTGKPVWKHASDLVVTGTPVLQSGRLIVQTRQNQVLALDAASGKWLWHYQREIPTGFTILENSTPIVSGGLVIAGFTDGAVAALNSSDGAVAWERKLSKSGQFSDISGSPLVVAGKLYAPVFNNGLACLDPATGKIEWVTELPGIMGLVPSGDFVVAVTGLGEVALFGSDGKIVKTRHIGGGVPSSPVPAGRNHLSVSTRSGSVYIIDRSSLAVAQMIKPGSGVTSAPFSTTLSLFFLTNKGVLYRYARPGVSDEDLLYTGTPD